MKRINILLLKKKVYFIVFISLLIAVLIFLVNSEDKKIDRIFLITIDTLRADHMGCYNYFRDTTPFIDSLASNGFVFDKAISQSATTCSSIASILTGLYPSEHKVLANGFVLDDSFVTLPELLKERGFTTAAFTSTDRHFLASNIDQGFDIYDEPEDTEKMVGMSYMPGKFVIKKVVEWLGGVKKDKKFFIWIHLFDPHLPFNVPKSKIKAFYPIDERKKFREKLKIHLKATENDLYKKFLRIDQMFTKYDSEIRSVDDQIRSLFQFAEGSGLNKRSLWVISADHGEGLGQHKWREHAMELYQESIHVPLIFYSPDKIRGSRYNNVVENFSIFSTLLEMTGDLKDSYGGFKISAGSYAKLIKNDVAEPEGRLTFSERQILDYINQNGELRESHRKFYKEGDKYSIQSDRFKYILRTKGDDEFFDLKNDPYELSNLFGSNNYKKEGDILKKKILHLISQIKRRSAISGKLTDKKTIEKLKSLGYIF